MARLLARIGGIWMVLSVPSLVGWGLVVRWSDAGAARFERVWRWFADLIALPLMFRPLTDHCFAWLRNGNAVEATAGFVVVAVIWCLMFAVPLAAIWSWADWVGRRTTPGNSRSSASSGYAPGTGADPTGAINALYLVTIPLALLWLLLKRLASGLPVALVVFIIAWVIRYLVVLAQVGHGDRFELIGTITDMHGTWQGRWHRLYLHHLYGPLWDRAFRPTQDYAYALANSNWQSVNLFKHAGDHAFVFGLFAVEAALWATPIALVVWALIVILPASKPSATA